MKKIFISFAALLLGILSFAQDFPQRDETGITENISNDYFPQAGEFGIGIDGTPFFNYLGNMFNATEDNSLNLESPRLHFRYFISNDAAIRSMISIGSSSFTDKFYVRDDAAFLANPLGNTQIEDHRTISNQNFEIAIGYQMFRGSRRLRGFYGVDLGFAYRGETEKFQYGNQMTQANPLPTNGFGFTGAARPLEIKQSPEINLFLGVFTGGEYYLMPRLCIGAEMGFVYGHSFEGQAYRTQEQMVFTQHVVEQRATSPGSTSSSAFTTFPHMYGSLYFIFHF